MSSELSVFPIADEALAYEMAIAESEFREFGIVANAVHQLNLDRLQQFKQQSTDPMGSYADLDSYQIWSRTQYLLSERAKTGKLSRYFAARADFESDVVLAKAHNIPTPRYIHMGRSYAPTSVSLESLDANKRATLIGTTKYRTDVPQLGAAIRSLEAIHVQKREETATRKADRMKQTRETYRPPTSAETEEALRSLDASVNPQLAKIYPKKQTITEAQLTAFNELEYLQPMSLLDGSIRKADIAVVSAEFVAKSAWQQLMSVAGDEIIANPQRSAMSFWRVESIERSFDSLTDRFNGTVTNVSVIDLPVTKAWAETFFTAEQRAGLYPYGIRRLRFVATLKSSGKPETYSRLDVVHYVRKGDASNAPSIVATRRKADRLTALAIQQSMVEESKAIAGVVTDALGHEVSAGLPTLGKN